MIALLQRVARAAVTIDGATAAEIGGGLLAFIGVEKTDDRAAADRLLRRLLSYRVFADEDGRMNLNVGDVRGGLLLVPQFTLAADTRRGNRPSFTAAAAASEAKQLFEYLLREAQVRHKPVDGGVFGADMQVALVNDGPVTFWLRAAAGSSGDDK